MNDKKIAIMIKIKPDIHSKLKEETHKAGYSIQTLLEAFCNNYAENPSIFTLTKTISLTTTRRANEIQN